MTHDPRGLGLVLSFVRHVRVSLLWYILVGAFVRALYSVTCFLPFFRVNLNAITSIKLIMVLYPLKTLCDLLKIR